MNRDPTRTELGSNSILLSDGFDLRGYNASGVQNETAIHAKDVDFMKSIRVMVEDS